MLPDKMMKTTRSLCLQTIDIRRNALTWELQVVGQNVACSEFKHQSPLSQQWSALSRARALQTHFNDVGLPRKTGLHQTARENRLLQTHLNEVCIREPVCGKTNGYSHTTNISVR